MSSCKDNIGVIQTKAGSMLFEKQRYLKIAKKKEEQRR